MAARAPAAAVALVLFGATAAGAQPGEPRAELTPEVRVAGGPHGPHLVDVKGRPLYRFEADQRAEGDTPPESRCRDECPPLVSRGEDPRSGDPAEGRITGHRVQDAGGAWILMRPRGEPPAEPR